MPGKAGWQSYEQYHQTAENQNKYGHVSDWVNGIFGGPVGWGKIATREQGLGGNFGEHHAHMGLTEEEYNMMTDDELQQYEKLDANAAPAFLAKVRERAAGDTKAAKAKSDRDLIMQKVQAFADEMNMPVEELLKHDTFAKGLQASTTGAAMTSAANRGIGGGGISLQNADLTSKKALLGYQMQRQQMGQQAQKQVWDMSNYEQGLDLQLQQANAAAQYQKYMQGMGEESGKLGMVGGIIGGIYGGGAGAAAGQKIGSSVGEQRYQNTNTFTPASYRYPSSGGIGSGGGNY